MSSLSAANKKFYSDLYSHRNAVLHWLHSRLSFDQQAKSRANHAVIDPLLAELLRVKESVKLLDYGSGWGTFLFALPRGVEAYCFDLADNTVRVTQNVMRFFGRSVRTISWQPDGAITPDDFDIVVCSHVLEHVESDEKLMKQLSQALRPGGWCLINVPINEVWEDPKHVRWYDGDRLEDLMTEAGLHIEISHEEDRWTAFLLEHEHAHPVAKPWLLALRGLRALLAVLPRSLVKMGERLFVSHYPFQQLIMLGRKPESQKATAAAR
jgi:2-polyprenyl-3-methyl-5-hydroxy-6-metoxy-1,4-benzoquinol methylase